MKKGKENKRENRDEYEMKKIMFYINTINTGGAERVIVNLSKYFSEHGWNVVLVTSFKGDNEYETAPNVKRLFLEEKESQQNRLAKNISRVRMLRKHCRQEKPDVLISFMAEANFRSVIATLGLKTKCIISVRNDPNKEYAGKIGRIVGKYLLPLADGCVFQTEQAKSWFAARLQKKSAIIMNAVKEDFFSTEWDGGNEAVVTCGRLTEQKNHLMLIDAFSKVQQKHPNATLRIYGEGQLKKKIQQRIDELNLSESAFMMGRTEHVELALRDASVFVLSSDYEGMPNCLLEAMAVGLPCVSTACPCGGPEMIIENEKNGLLTPVGDAEKMAEAISKLLDNTDMSKNIGAEAKRMAEGFRPETIFSQWERYVNYILSH